jgi:Uma2 family endonuclease
MSTAVIESGKQSKLEPRQAFVLTGIDWATYRKISEALTDHHVRLTYDRGDLELMTKSIFHGILSRLYHTMMVVLAEEHKLPFASCGDMTCDREDLDRGAEPDECFYLLNAPLVRGKRQIDLTTDPPPDLVVEVDLTTNSRRRLAIYAAIQVPEVWKVTADSLTVLRLGADGCYVAVDRSIYFPAIDLSALASFVRREPEMDQLALLGEFRAWVRECLSLQGE